MGADFPPPNPSSPSDFASRLRWLSPADERGIKGAGYISRRKARNRIFKWVKKAQATASFAQDDHRGATQRTGGSAWVGPPILVERGRPGYTWLGPLFAAAHL